MRAFAILLGLLAASACGQAQTHPPPPGAALPVTVTTALTELTGLCSGAGGVPHTDKAVQRADLNADGAEDFVLYAGWIGCDNAASIYGDREKALMVFAGDGLAGAVQVFSGSVYDAKIEKQDGAAKLWLGVSAESCGRPQAATFAEETFCDRAIVWQARTKRFDYAPIETVRLIK